MNGPHAGTVLATTLLLACLSLAGAHAQPAATERKPAPIPETIPVTVSGLARDDGGKPVPGARVFVISTGPFEPRLAGQATTDANGRYRIEGAWLAVVRQHPGRSPLPPDVTPYADFVVCGMAPGLGLAWSDPQTMYALDEPNPGEIRGRLPLGGVVRLVLNFPAAGTAVGPGRGRGRQARRGRRVQVLAANLLDDAGRETNNGLNDAWTALPGSIGSAATDDAGRFTMDGLPDRAVLPARRHPPRDRSHGPVPVCRDDRRPGYRARRDAARRFPRPGAAPGQGRRGRHHLPAHPADRRHRHRRRHRSAGRRRPRRHPRRRLPDRRSRPPARPTEKERSSSVCRRASTRESTPTRRSRRTTSAHINVHCPSREATAISSYGSC